MKSLTSRLMLLLLLAAGNTLRAQVTVSGGTAAAGSYTTMSAATAALNGTPLTGAVTITVTASYTETSTIVLGSATLNASTSPTKTITINGGGRTITARAGGVSTTTDGILKVVGTDYVNISNLSLRENNANTNATTQMEWGIALLRRNATDGVHVVNITNCTVSLNKTNYNSSCIYASNIDINNSLSGLTISTLSGANSDIHINGCTLTNACNPIWIASYTGTPSNPAFSDTGLQIGTTTGNTISGFGSPSFTGGISCGIVLYSQVSPSVEHNTIISDTANISVCGISANSENSGGITISANTVTVSARSGGTGYGSICAIAASNYYSPGTTSIANNIIRNCRLYNDNSNGQVNLINANAFDLLNVIGNTVSGTNIMVTPVSGGGGGSQSLMDISGDFGAILNVSNNQLSDNHLTVAPGASPAWPNYFYGINITGFRSSAITANNNQLYDLTFSSAAAMSYNVECAAMSLTGSRITASGNKIHDITNSIMDTASTDGNGITGIFAGVASRDSVLVHTFSNNELYLIGSVPRALPVTGIKDSWSWATYNDPNIRLTMSGNYIHDISNTGAQGATTALSFAGNMDALITGNKLVYLFSPYSVTGISAASPFSKSKRTISNNLVSEFRDPTGQNAGMQQFGISFSGNDSVRNRVYYNTICAFDLYNQYPVFSFRKSAAIYTGGGDSLDLRNNILINDAASGNGNKVAGIWVENPADFRLISDNNLLYTTRPGTDRYLLYKNNPAMGYQTLAAYQAAVAPNDTNSFTGELQYDYAGGTTPFFTSRLGYDSLFLRPLDGLTTRAGGGAAVIPGITTDYGNAPRSATRPDIGAWEFAQSHNPVIALSSMIPGATAQCAATARTISATVTTDTGTVATVSIYYTVNGLGGTTVPMTHTSGNTWTGTIPAAVPVNAGIYWELRATSTAGYSSVYTGATYRDAPLAAFPAVATASAANICPGASDTLRAAIPSVNLFSELFEGNVPGSFTLSGSASASATKNTVYHQQGSSSAYLNTTAVNDAATMTMTAGIDLTPYGSAPLQLKWSQICGMEGPATAYDFGYVEYSSNGGTTWTAFPASSYAGSGALFGGVTKFSALSYPDWAGTFTSAASLPNNNIWHSETINIPAAAVSAQFKVRFRYTTGAIVNYYGWLIDSVSISAAAPAPAAYTWSDGSSTVGTTNPLVITPSATKTYTATITAGGCTATTNGVTVNVNIPDASFTAPAALCANAAVPAVPAVAGGTWTSSNTGVVTVSSSGVMTGIAPGTAVIRYKVINGSCVDSTAKSIAVNALPDASFTAPAALCINATASATPAVAGGTWSSSNTAVATVSSTGIVTAIAPGTASVRYRIANAAGCTDSSSKTITVNPLPVITVSPAAAAVCPGYSVQLAAAGALSYSWLPSAGLNATTGATVTAAPAATTTYTVTGTDATGCSGTASGTVTVSPLPDASITGAPAVCVNSTTALVPGSAGGTWTSSNTAVATVTSAGIVTGIAPGTVQIRYVNTNAAGCRDSAAKTITVNALPAISISPVTAAVCAGSSLTLQANGAVSYQWSPSAGLSTPTAATVIATPAATTLYQVTGTDANGCSNTSSRTVTVNLLPDASFGLPADICMNAAATALPAVSGGGWTSSNTAVATVGSAGTVTGIAPGTDTIRYRVTNAAGCTDSSYKVITIRSLPDATINGASGACINTVVTLTGATPGGSWTSSNTGIATVSSNGAVTALAPGTDTIRYTVTNANGCTGTAVKIFTVATPPVASITGPASLCMHAADSLTGLAGGGTWSSSNPAILSVDNQGHIYGVAAGTDTVSYTVTVSGCSNTVPKVIIVHALPVATITAGGPLAICAGDSVSLTAHAAAASYRWTMNAAPTPVTDSIYHVRASGSYRVITTSAAGCTDTSAAVAVLVHPTPVPAITANGNVLSTGAYSAYRWYLNGSLISNATAGSYTATQNGSYYVVVTDANGCTGSSATVTLSHVSVAEHNGIRDIHVYPNPAHDMVYIDAARPVNVTIYAADGRKLAYSEQVSSIDMTRYPAASYTLVITDREGSFRVVRQLIKAE